MWGVGSNVSVDRGGCGDMLFFVFVGVFLFFVFLQIGLFQSINLSIFFFITVQLSGNQF